MLEWLVGWTARSFRDGTPFTVPCEGRKAHFFTPFLPIIEPQAVAWQSITLPARHASSTGKGMLESITVDDFTHMCKSLKRNTACFT